MHSTVLRDATLGENKHGLSSVLRDTSAWSCAEINPPPSHRSPGVQRSRLKPSLEGRVLSSPHPIPRMDCHTSPRRTHGVAGLQARGQPPTWPPTQKIPQRRFTSKGASGHFETQAPSLEGGSPSPAPRSQPSVQGCLPTPEWLPRIWWDGLTNRGPLLRGLPNTVQSWPHGLCPTFWPHSCPALLQPHHCLTSGHKHISAHTSRHTHMHTGT